MKTAIIIPARYGSSRFPGKPLVKLGGETMLSRVVKKAKKAAEGIPDTKVIVTSEDDRILNHASELNVEAIKTSNKCRTGTDRVWEAVSLLNQKPLYILNLQGDTPFMPSSIIKPVLEAFDFNAEWDVITPVIKLTWKQLDALIKRKKEDPFSSGTTVVRSFNEQDPENLAKALWFSKQIIPSIRDRAKEEEKDSIYSPIFRHIGLYAYRYEALKRFGSLSETRNESLEGLEQLRLIENGMSIFTVKVKTCSDIEIPSGIDTPNDVVWAEKLLKEHPILAE